jgi:hypothetical protein
VSSLIRAALFSALSAAAAHAQTPVTGAPTPEALATLVMEKFANGTPAEFNALFPDSAGRVFKRSNAPKRADLARVVAREPSRAVLLLSGTTAAGGGTNQTNNARNFSGFYEARLAGSQWRVIRQIPFDTLNFIRAHDIAVNITPGVGIDVVDTMSVTVGAAHGFGFRINNDVKLARVTLNGRPAEYAQGGGVMWINAPRGTQGRLVLEYSIASARRANDSTTAAPAFGAFHNTDMWHPAFDYMSANHLAPIRVVAKIPAEYYLTTTVPQTDTVRGGVRTVYGNSTHSDFLLALIFDREWRPQTTDYGSFRFESFTTADFRHPHDTLAARVKHLYDLLTPRFGEPRAPARYLAAVENRSLGANGGFNVAMNSAAISGGRGSALGSANGQVFAHEVGHTWTVNATGIASNFLREGWARLVESLVLRDLFGAQAESDYWEAQRNQYMVGNDRSGWAGGFEGRQSILTDFDNGRIHYTKGSWILHAGQWVLGDAVFNQGMRYFIDGMGKGPSGYQELISAWSRAAGRDMRSFVMPWLVGKYIPDIDAQVAGDRLIVTQSQPGEVYDLPRFEIELTTANGTVLHTMHLRQRADTLRLAGVGNVTAIRVDPNHRFLIQRKLGDVVRFELPVSSLPGAQSVRLNGNFLRQGVTLPAARSGDTWVVEVPLTEGRYVFAWAATNAAGEPIRPQADPALSGTRTVLPVRRIDNAYPGR